MGLFCHNKTARVDAHKAIRRTLPTDQPGNFGKLTQNCTHDGMCVRARDALP